MTKRKDSFADRDEGAPESKRSCQYSSFGPESSVCPSERLSGKARSKIYTTLGANRQIRLLRVGTDCASNGAHALLQCELVTVSLDDDIEYDALSYVWGDPDDCKPIRLDGHVYQVTINLYNALYTFSETKDSAIQGYIWIDALCINQADVEERGRQVGMMSAIYRQAQTVHIWLGLHGKHTRAALQALQHFSVTRSLFTSQLDDNVLLGLDDFLSRPWWYRVWVISEAVASSRALLHIGGHFMDFWEVFKVLGKFNVGVLRGSLVHLEDKQHNQLDKICDSILRICASFNVQDLFAETTAGIDDVLRLLNYGEARKATDFRDLVYGFLGLLPRSLAITPDYTLSTEEVYKSTTMRLMTWSKSLTPLAYTKHRKSSTLPSWTPDMRYDSFDNELTSFDACPGLPALMQELHPGQLRVYGKVIDSIDLATGRCLILSHEPILGTKWYNEFRIHLMQCENVAFERSRMSTFKQPYGQTSQEYQGTLLPDPRDTFDRKSRDSFWRALTRHNSKASKNAARFDSQNVCMSEIESWLSWLPRAQRWDERNAWSRWNNEISGVSREAETTLRDIRLEVDGRVFFRTTNDRFGQTSALPKSGDVIALLAGLRCPMILRKNRSNFDHWEVIGPCYYEGGMHGELIPTPAGIDEPRDASECGFEELVLV